MSHSRFLPRNEWPSSLPWEHWRATSSTGPASAGKTRRSSSPSASRPGPDGELILPLRSRIEWFIRLRDLLDLQGRVLAPTRARIRRLRMQFASESPVFPATFQALAGALAAWRPPVLTNIALALRQSTDTAATQPHSMRHREKGFARNYSLPAPAITPAPGTLSSRKSEQSAPSWKRSPVPSWKKPDFSVGNKPVGQTIATIALSQSKVTPGWARQKGMDALMLSPPAASAAGLQQERGDLGTSLAPPPRMSNASGASVPQDLDPAWRNLKQISGPTAVTRESPARSTLYIDGHALGRWTMQHLERALGRAPSGMTGVDPRASIPRSRVSPF